MSQASRVRTLERLTRRADYLAAAKGRRHHTPRLSLQAAERPAECDVGETARVGLTVSRKVGNAVERNRVKRRLRAALRQMAEGAGAECPARPRFDYVVVARREALAAPFVHLVDDLREGIAAVHRPRGAQRARRVPPIDRPAHSRESQ